MFDFSFLVAGSRYLLGSYREGSISGSKGFQGVNARS